MTAPGDDLRGYAKLFLLALPDPPAGHWGNQSAPCLHPEHNPPGHAVLEPGRYEYTCPACGKVELITVAGHSWTTGGQRV